jgi:GT2 family glycosyltransferase
MTPLEGLTHDIVICTRNRPDDLHACLETIATQTSLPDVVWIVDASSNDDTEVVCRAANTPAMPVHHVRSEPSTSRQRNTGVRRSGSDVVHFLDDDVLLERDYLSEILRVFLDQPGALGVGGLPTNLPDFTPGWLRRLFAPASTQQGRVLASGRGVLVYDVDGPTYVDWLSGCCMSFRRTAVLREPFDEGMTGYALGEDLDMSYRVRQHGRLVVTPSARLVHLESPTNRLNPRDWAMRDAINRHRRVGSGVGRFRPTAYWASIASQVVYYAARGVVTRSAVDRATAAGLARGAIRSRRGNRRGGEPSTA